MANTIDFILTTAAYELISKALNGKTVNFTRMAIGEGFSYDTTVAKGYTTLVNEVLSIDIIKSETLSPSSVRITSVFKNTDAQKEFYYREVGLYAQDPDSGKEVLYAYGNRNDAAELITPSGSSVVTKQLVFIITVGNSANVTFNINANVYALQEDMVDVQADIKMLNSTKVNQSDHYVTPEMFGAVGNGVTDDTEAFKKMFASEYGNIVLGFGKTYIIQKIEVSKNNLKLDLNSSTIKNSNGLYDGVTKNEGFFNVSNCNNVIIKNGTFDNNGQYMKRPRYGTEGYDEYTDLRAKTYISLKLNTVENFHISNCKFTHSSAGMFATRCTNGEINDCLSTETLADGYFITGKSTRITVSGCKTYLVGDDSFSSDGYNDEENSPSQILFTNCIARDSFGSLICFYGSSNVRATNCHGYNLRYLPFKLGVLRVSGTILGSACHNQSIENCSVTINEDISGDSALDIQSTSSGRLVDGNIDSFASNLTLKNCTIINNTNFKFIMVADYCNNLQITGCDFRGVGLFMSYLNKVNISNNIFTLISTLFLDRCNHSSICNNYIYTSKADTTHGEYSLWVLDSSNVTVVGNNLTDGASFYSNLSVSNIVTDEVNARFSANVSGISILGVYVPPDNNFMTFDRYAKGQLVMKNDGTLIVNTGSAFKTITTT